MFQWSRPGRSQLLFPPPTQTSQHKSAAPLVFCFLVQCVCVCVGDAARECYPFKFGLFQSRTNSILTTTTKKKKKMPFVLRQVTPVRLSRLGVNNSSQTAAGDKDDDVRQLISNQTLSACLRQLASLVSLASDIFTHCHDEASLLQQRTAQLRHRLDRLQSNADQRLDSRSVAIRKFLFSSPGQNNNFYV